MKSETVHNALVGILGVYAEIISDSHAEREALRGQLAIAQKLQQEKRELEQQLKERDLRREKLEALAVAADAWLVWSLTSNKATGKLGYELPVPEQVLVEAVRALDKEPKEE